MKTKQYLLFYILITIMFVFSGMAVAAESNSSYEEALNKTVNYYVYNQTSLTHWQEIVGLSEAGENVSEDPWQLPEWDIDGLDGDSDALDYMALILSLDAVGEDPKSIEGRDLVEELAGLQNAADGSFGAQTRLTYWAMIALDQADGDYDAQMAIDYLLSQQNDNGGFSWINKATTPETDSTGIALLALANHRKMDGVEEAIEKAISYLQGVQKSNGGFGTNDVSSVNCESTACVVMGLLACEEDIVSEDWQKNDQTMVDAFLSFQLSDGSFSHVADSSSNTLATRQALMALIRVVESGIGGSGGSGGSGGDNPSDGKTVRVRVEGHTTSLADETVTVVGTALDALKAAVGEDQVDAPGGWLSTIKGESGQYGIAEGIDTNWMYYVMREGAIEPGAFDLGAGSYNVEDGDEIIFYIGASDSLTYESKTYMPQVSVIPGNITAGQTVTISISAKKYVWPDGLSDLNTDEISAIGNYTVQVGDYTYTSSYGQVAISNISAGTMDLIVSNASDHGYSEVVTYKRSIVVETVDEKTVRVRVEGHTTSLADETVTVVGTALDALKAAVGEDQVDAPGGWLSTIKGESGQYGIAEGIDTNWMYYVMREGAIELGAFDLGAGSYNVEDGDEIIFYLGASDASTWASKTYLPQVSLDSSDIEAGDTVIISINAQKYVYPDGLMDLTTDEKTAIGEFTVLVGEDIYTSSSGEVVIPDVEKGMIEFTITNASGLGYPDVVTYKGSFLVEEDSSSGGGGPGNSNEITVKVAVVGKGGKKDILFISDSVELSKDDEYGWTALGALDATGLDWELSKDNDDFVIKVGGQRNQGLSGWMYKVNSDAPESSARVTKVKKRDEIIWWYSDDPNSKGPDWADLVSEGSAGGASDAANEEVTKSTITGYKDDLAGLNQIKLLNQDKKMTAQAAATLKDELAKNTVSLSFDAGRSESFLADQEVSLLIPEDGLSQTTKITVTEVALSQQPKQFAIKLGSSVYEFGPSGTKFDQLVTMAIKVPLTEDIDVNKLSPAWYNEETKNWLTIPAVIDLESGLVVCQIDHFTKFAVLQFPEKKSFSDVGEGMSWAKDAVEILAGKGFINGTGGTGFEPKRSISRAEFVKIITTALGLEPKSYTENLFGDVKIGDWFAGYVQSAYENQIITGGQGEKFRPQDSISRNEVAAIFYRLQESVAASSQNTSLTFKDAAQIPVWAAEGINYVNRQGLMTGYGDGTFKGSNSLTRAEAAVTVYRFLGFREE